MSNQFFYNIIIALSMIILIVQSGPTIKPDSELIADITYKDTLTTSEQIFCINQHGDRFVFSATLESDGCQIKCTFWASSSSHYHKYYDTVDVVHYNVSDNLPCGRRGSKNFCRSGHCIDRDNLPGQAVLTLVDGWFPDQDYFSATDAYILVYVTKNDKPERYIDLGSTRVIEDDNSPSFDTTFTSPLANKTGHFYLVAKDRDSSPDDYICSFTINFNQCKENVTCEESNGRYSINYKLRWISQEP